MPLFPAIVVRQTAMPKDQSSQDDGKNRMPPSYYQEFLAQREEVMRYKWIHSEREGRDIGFERALVSWVRQERDAWRRKRQQWLGGE